MIRVSLACMRPMYSLLMSASFNRLLVFRPVQQPVLMLVLAGVGALAAIAVVLSDLPWWGRALASAVAGAILVLEVCHLRRVPSSLQRLPNGVWLTYPSFTKVRAGEKKSTKCMLLRHFLVGNLSITMVLKDRPWPQVSYLVVEKCLYGFGMAAT